MKKRISGSEWARRVEAWKSSGLTAAEFGARHCFDSRQLSWWKWWLRNKADAPGLAKPPAVRFLPVKVSPAAVAAVEPRPLGAELVLGRGAVLRIPEGSDPAWAAHLVVRVIAESRSC